MSRQFLGLALRLLGQVRGPCGAVIFIILREVQWSTEKGKNVDNLC